MVASDGEDLDNYGYHNDNDDDDDNDNNDDDDDDNDNDDDDDDDDDDDNDNDDDHDHDDDVTNLPSELSRRQGGSHPLYFCSSTCRSPGSSPKDILQIKSQQ